MKELTLEMALKMLEAAERWAREIAGFPCSIAVVDKSGTVIGPSNGRSWHGYHGYCD